MAFHRAVIRAAAQSRARSDDRADPPRADGDVRDAGAAADALRARAARARADPGRRTGGRSRTRPVRPCASTCSRSSAICASSARSSPDRKRPRRPDVSPGKGQKVRCRTGGPVIGSLARGVARPRHRHLSAGRRARGADGDRVDFVWIDLEHGALDVRDVAAARDRRPRGGRRGFARLPVGGRSPRSGRCSTPASTAWSPRGWSARPRRRLVSTGCATRRAARAGSRRGARPRYGPRPTGRRAPLLVQIESAAGAAAADGSPRSMGSRRWSSAAPTSPLTPASRWPTPRGLRDAIARVRRRLLGGRDRVRARRARRSRGCSPSSPAQCPDRRRPRRRRAPLCRALADRFDGAVGSRRAGRRMSAPEAWHVTRTLRAMELLARAAALGAGAGRSARRARAHRAPRAQAARVRGLRDPQRRPPPAVPPDDARRRARRPGRRARRAPRSRRGARDRAARAARHGLPPVRAEPPVRALPRPRPGRRLRPCRPHLRELVPCHCTAAGKALLAWRESWREAVLAQPLASFTERTTTGPESLRRELARTVARGYSVEDREYEADTRGLAAPVFAETGEAVAALAVVAPADGCRPTATARSAPRSWRPPSSLSAELGHDARRSRR